MVGQLPVNHEEVERLKQEVELLKTMLGAIKLHNEYLEQKLEKTNNDLKAALDKAQEAAINAQNTANHAVNLANGAQGTANHAVNLANNAQHTANGAVKNIKFFPARAVIDTHNQENNVQIAFPERVDPVVLESIENDGNQMWRGQISRVNDTTFKVNFRGIHGNGHRWIPCLRYIGIQVSK